MPIKWRLPVLRLAGERVTFAGLFLEEKEIKTFGELTNKQGTFWTDFHGASLSWKMPSRVFAVIYQESIGLSCAERKKLNRLSK